MTQGTPRRPGLAASAVEVALVPLARLTAAGMFVVLVMGATVTNTGSAEGCGRSWPLCHGQLIPSFAVATLIEFSHRAVTGVETILVLALAALAWLVRGHPRRMRVLALLMVGTLFLQAGMGAWAVLSPQSPLVIALHFGISLGAFASALLVAASAGESQAGFPRWSRAVPPGYARLAWGTVLYLLVVVYLGAYVRHAGIELACRGWPLCNGQIIPSLTGAVGIVFAHRVAALGAVALLIGLAVRSWHLRAVRPDLAGASLLAVLLVLAQALSGAYIVATSVGLWSALLHAALTALLFGTVCVIGLASLPAPQPTPAAGPTTSPDGWRSPPVPAG